MRFPMAPAVALLALVSCCAAEAGQRSPARADVSAANQAAAQAPPRASRRKARIVYLPSPSQESPEQRDRRLARECRGLPNAGACLGHALARPRATPARR
ncbi:MAG: hypothetical protein ABWY08_11205 [Comamonas sp.]